MRHLLGKAEEAATANECCCRQQGLPASTSSASAARTRAAPARSSQLRQAEAALRASCVDLGPKGISQAAKIMATGDESLGQASLLSKTGTHIGAGARSSVDLSRGRGLKAEACS